MRRAVRDRARAATAQERARARAQERERKLLNALLVRRVRELHGAGHLDQCRSEKSVKEVSRMVETMLAVLGCD